MVRRVLVNQTLKTQTALEKSLTSHSCGQTEDKLRAWLCPRHTSGPLTYPGKRGGGSFRPEICAGIDSKLSTGTSKTKMDSWTQFYGIFSSSLITLTAPLGNLLYLD